MTGVLPDFLAIYDSCMGIYAIWCALLALGLPAIAACLSAELSYARESRSYAARTDYAAYRETVRERLVRYTSGAASLAPATPAIAVALACASVAPISSPTLVPVESRAVETIGQGCEGSQPVALDSLRPTRIIPCVVRGVCRYRDAATGRFVRFDATNTPV